MKGALVEIPNLRGDCNLILSDEGILICNPFSRSCCKICNCCNGRANHREPSSDDRNNLGLMMNVEQ